jgi:hypothetical protein
VLHTPPAERTAARPWTISLDVVSGEPVDSVVLFARRAGARGRMLRLAMEPTATFTYQARVPADEMREGLFEYAVATYTAGEARTFPAGVAGDPFQWDFTGREFWQVPVVGEGSPVLLFDGRQDLGHVLYPHPWEYVSFRTEIASGSEPGALALSAVVEDFTRTPHHFALRTFLPKGRRTRLSEVTEHGVLHIRARAAGRASDRLEVSVVERDGAAWGTVLDLTDQWREFAIPVSALRPTALALLPRPYPQFLPYLRAPTTTRAAPRLADLDGLQFSVAANLFQGGEAAGPHGFRIDRVVLSNRP